MRSLSNSAIDPKHPAFHDVFEGRKYLLDQAASNDPRLIDRWIEICPDAELGVDGRESDLFLVDLDYDPGKDKDGTEALARLFLKYFPAGDNLVERLDDSLEDPRVYGEAPPIEYANPDNPFGNPLRERRAGDDRARTVTERLLLLPHFDRRWEIS